MGKFKEGRIPWNKGLTKHTDERVNKIAKQKITKINFNCVVCNKPFQRNMYQKDRAKYCSKICNNIAHKGKRFSPETEIKKGDTRNRGDCFYLDKSTGYMVKVLNNKQILEHHYVWVKHNQFPVPKGFVIHHRDMNKTNNHIDNLLLLPKRYHTSIHQKLIKGEI
jgi:hypothetical protein